jgi:hypothetical protein
MHLFVVVTEEDDSGMHVLVNVSSIDQDIPHDDTCIINVGDHDFIKQPSYAAYEFATQYHKRFIDSMVARKVYKIQKDASLDLVSKICDGLKKSYFTKRAIKDAYDATLRAVAKRQKTKT